MCIRDRCAFYASDYHFEMMTLPYISKKLDESKKVVILSENNLNEDVYKRQVLNIFPTLIGLFVAVGALRSSGILDLIINFITPILDILNFPRCV